MSGRGSVAAGSSSFKSHIPKSVVTWRRLPDLPCAMFLPQVVVTTGTVYVGGGVSRNGMLDIYAYDFSSGTWSTLPCNNVMVFGMCMFQDRLITVGGGTAQGLTNKAFSTDPSEEVQKWEEFPSMQYARMALSVISANDLIVAIGGAVWVVGKKDPTPISTVEVYHGKTRQWEQVSDIPYPCASVSTTVMGDMCYLMGDIHPDEKRKVLCVDLLQFEHPAATPPDQILESHTQTSSSSTSSLSTSIPSQPLSSTHTHPDNTATTHKKKVSTMDETKTQESINSKRVVPAAKKVPRTRGIPSIIITSSRCTTMSPLAQRTSPATDNAASATVPQSASVSDTSQAIPLSHSPVNAVSSLTSNTSISPASPSPLSPISPISPCPNMALTPGDLVGTLSKSMPDLDRLPRVKTPHHFNPRSTEGPNWFTLPPPPTENGCILGINDHLVSFGGSRNGELYQAMLVYSKRYDRWLKVIGADIPLAVEGCSATVLQTGEILLVGGEDSEGDYSHRVYIGSPA